MSDEDVTLPEDRRVEVYKDKQGRYRWRLVADRGNLPDEVIADSGQGYNLSRSAKVMAENLFPGVPVEVKKS